MTEQQNTFKSNLHILFDEDNNFVEAFCKSVQEKTEAGKRDFLHKLELIPQAGLNPVIREASHNENDLIKANIDNRKSNTFKTS